MAAPTVTLDFLTPARLGNTGMGMICGTVNVSSYDTADPEVTDITGKFLSAISLRVCPNGLSSNGYMIVWNPTSKSFQAYRGAVTVANPTMTTVTNAGTAAADAIYQHAGVLNQPTGTAGITGIIQGAVATAAPTEAAGSVNVGTFDFIAVGRIGG